MNSIFEPDPVDSAITPVQVDNIESETAAQGVQTQGIEDQVLTAGGAAPVEEEEAEDAADEQSQEADVANLGWATP